MSDEQKLTWARENNVAAPAFLQQRVAEAKKADCQHAAGGSCCSTTKAVTAPACRAAEKESGTSEAEGESRRGRLVLLISEYRCRGVGFLMAVLSSALPYVPGAAWQPEYQAAPLLALIQGAPCDVTIPPPTPPPRLASNC